MITIDGRTLDSFGLIAQPEQVHEVIAGTIDRTVSITHRDGAYNFGADLMERRFAIPLAWAKEISRESLQVKIRNFAAFLVNSRGKPRDIILRFDYEPDKYYTARYSGNNTPERLLSMAFFILPLAAFDPSAYGDEQIFENTFATSPYVVEVGSAGAVETSPVITLQNTGSGTIQGFTITSEILAN